MTINQVQVQPQEAKSPSPQITEKEQNFSDLKSICSDKCRIATEL